jgi:hypothetical protein
LIPSSWIILLMLHKLKTTLNMKKYFFTTTTAMLLLLTLLTLADCRKDDSPQDCPPDLPCATQTGANTFGCYIDGVPWVAKVEPNVLDPTSHPFEVSYDETGYGGFNNNNVKIKARYHSTEKYDFFSILFAPLINVGDIEFDSLAYTNFLFRYSQKSYYLDRSFPHNLNISKLDTVKRVLSGSFYFTVINSDDTIKITDGRFDLKYSPE